jgi:hypothetical protein
MFKTRFISTIRGVSDHWREINELPKKDRRIETSSAARRWDFFLRFQALKRILGQTIGGIDFSEIMEEGKIAIFNLGLHRTGITDQCQRFLGSLILHQVKAAASRRRKNRATPVYLLVDEFQRFANFDIMESLARLSSTSWKSDCGRGIGLYGANPRGALDPPSPGPSYKEKRQPPLHAIPRSRPTARDHGCRRPSIRLGYGKQKGQVLGDARRRGLGSGWTRASGHVSRRFPPFLHDWGGLQGTGGDNELAWNSLPSPNLTAKVAHRRHFSKTRDAGSMPAASTDRPPDGSDSPASHRVAPSYTDSRGVE